MINKALDLPFDDPQETYSSSENFLHDQGIAPGTKGRIVPEGTVERKPRPDRPERGGQGGRGRGGDKGGGRSRGQSGPESSGSGEKKSGDRPARKRNRSRSRTRGGRPAAAGEN
jgi:hypothetical protein